MSDLITFVVVLALYLLAILFVATGIYFLISVARSIHRIASAKKDQADAVWDIALTLDEFLVDDTATNTSSKGTRLVAALEKLAGIGPPADPKAGDGVME